MLAMALYYVIHDLALLSDLFSYTGYNCNGKYFQVNANLSGLKQVLNRIDYYLIRKNDASQY